MVLEAVVVLKAVVDAFQRLGSAAVEDTCPEAKAAAVDICPERVDAAEGPRPPRIETVVDICPERVDVADAEGPGPPRVETAVGFWSGMGVETAVLRRFFWRSKKKKQKQEAADECYIGTDNYISPRFLNIQSTYTKLAVLLTVYSRLTDIPQSVGFSI